LKSTSSLLSPHCLHEDHFEVADGVIRNLQHYKNLQDIIAILGVDELSEDDQLIITRARKIELFLGQPLSVVAYPRSQETYVHLDDTLKGFQVFFSFFSISLILSNQTKIWLLVIVTVISSCCY